MGPWWVGAGRAMRSRSSSSPRGRKATGCWAQGLPAQPGTAARTPGSAEGSWSVSVRSLAESPGRPPRPPPRGRDAGEGAPLSREGLARAARAAPAAPAAPAARRDLRQARPLPSRGFPPPLRRAGLGLRRAASGSAHRTTGSGAGGRRALAGQRRKVRAGPGRKPAPARSPPPRASHPPRVLSPGDGDAFSGKVS